MAKQASGYAVTRVGNLRNAATVVSLARCRCRGGTHSILPSAADGRTAFKKGPSRLLSGNDNDDAVSGISSLVR